ncbi:MAG: flotillin family protein [Eubacterium sp.]|nr:flotillin family protein [Eubacterium sp.]
MLFHVLTIVIPVIVIIALVIIGSKVMYKQAPPNVAMVVTGPSGSKTIIGKGCFVIPIIQRVDKMSLENIQADFTSRDEIPTKDAINILVDAVANIAISQDPERLKIASSKFLGYSTDQIRAIVTPVLEGNIREIISQTTLKELIQGDKKQFAEKVMENVTPNLNDMGLELTTFNIQNFKDKKGVIEDLGIQNTVQISKDASKSKALAESEIAIAQAEADKAANEARVNADAEIARRQNELKIQKAALKKESDIKQAEADAAYDIQKEEQRKTIEVTTANANLARQEKELELKEREVSIQERKLEATIKKQAAADRYAAQQKADAELYQSQKSSEAELYERQRKAEAEAFEAKQAAVAVREKAEAKRFEMENEAAGVQAQGEAEAAAIRAKAEAEAEGLKKKAEAMKLYGDAAMQQMQLDALKVYFEQLPKIAEAVAAGYGSVDSIKLFGGEASNLSGNIVTTMTQITDGIKESSGIDLNSVLAGFLGGKMAKGDSVIQVQLPEAQIADNAQMTEENQLR